MTDEAAIDTQAQPHSAPSTPEASAAWMKGGLIYAVLAVFVSVMMMDAVAGIYHIATTSNTFGHILLIPAVIVWLIWQRLPELKQIIPSPEPMAGVLLLGTGFVWLLGRAADIQLAQQLAYVVTLQILVLTVFGRKGLMALLFPTAFALFLVPFGEEFIPVLQDVTAYFVVGGLNFLGIPVYTDGVFLQTPSGDFEVAEACSGIRFMVSTFALGTLFSVLCFKSLKRRLMVVVLSLLIPILANGARAFGIVYIAYVTDNEVAVGVDHIVYGWIFFSIVTVLLIGIGLTFSDRSVDDPPINPGKINALGGGALAYPSAIPSMLKMFAVPVISVGIFFAANAWMAARVPEADLAAFEVPAPPKGWTFVQDGALRDQWMPNYVGADQASLLHYKNGDFYAGLYRAGYNYQRQGAELIGFGNTAAAPDDIWGWASSGKRVVNIGGVDTQVQYILLRGNGGFLRETWQVYMVNGKLVSSAVRAKIETVLARLTGGPLYTGTLILSAPRNGMSDMQGGEAALERFAATLPPAAQLLQPAKEQ